MALVPASKTSTELPLSGFWPIGVRVLDSDGCWTTDAVTVTITLPNSTTFAPTVTDEGDGYYRATYVPVLSGRYIARATTATNGAADFTAFITATVAAAAMPDVDDVKDYLDENSWTDDQLQDALDAEAAAQRKVCTVPAAYPADLRQALLRRVQRNLAMRPQPFATIPDTEGVSVIPSRDPEVRRLEAAHRRMVMG